MKITETKIAGVYEVRLEPHSDPRGTFSELYNDGQLWEAGVQGVLRKINLATSDKAGTIRGMHWQADPEAQLKVVYSVKGVICDAVVDVRRNSATSGLAHSTTLTPHMNALIVPPGVAHGWQALEEGAALEYLIYGGRYSRPHERGVHPLKCGIKWPEEPIHAAPRDLEWPSLEEILA